MTTTVVRPEAQPKGISGGTTGAPAPAPAEEGTFYRVLKEILAVRAVETEGGPVIEGDPLIVLLELGLHAARTPKGAIEKAINAEDPEARGGTYVATPDRNWTTETPSGFRSVVDWGG